MAANSIVMIRKGIKTKLICKPTPDSQKTIESCRWLSPAKYGINGVHSHGRFNTTTKATHCELSIKGKDILVQNI